MKCYSKNNVSFGPAKAANAGGVATIALEMCQNSMRLSWTFEEVDTRLKLIMNSIYDQCKKCHIGTTRTKLVPGQGNPNARIVFVGEAPGADEDEQGLAFVGRAGKLLTDIITAMGLSRDDVFITNVVKCRPPENRDPKPDEIAACLPFLKRQLEVIQPGAAFYQNNRKLQPKHSTNYKQKKSPYLFDKGILLF